MIGGAFRGDKPNNLYYSNGCHAARSTHHRHADARSVSHDRAPSAFLLYLFLWRQTRGERPRRVWREPAELASDTGLSKSSVQNSLRRLKRRGLVSARRQGPTSACFYHVHEPWRRGGR